MTKILIPTFALVLACGMAQAADLSKGAAKADEVCSACHGKDGKTPIDPSYPVIAGQHADYLLQALRDYRAGARKNAIMGAQAKLLSPAEMEDVTAWYASLPSGLSSRK